jgi:hypothetical protein
MCSPSLHMFPMWALNQQNQARGMVLKKACM